MSMTAKNNIYIIFFSKNYILLIFLYFLLYITVNAQDSWSQKADFGGGIRNGAVGFSIGSKGYIGIGYNGSYNVDWWEYDPIANTWTQKANFTGTARAWASSFVINSKGYIACGYDGTNSLSTLHEYNPIANTWAIKTSIPGTSREGSVGFSLNSLGYIVAGRELPANNFLTTMYAYNPITDSWTQRASYPVGVNYAIGFSIGNKGYVGTGSGSGGATQSFYEYDPNSNSWAIKANFGGGVYGNSEAFVIGNKGYAVCGTNVSNFNTNTLYEFDPTNNSWSSKSVFPPGTRGDMASFVISDKAYAGIGENGGYYQDFYEYTPGTTASVNSTIISNITMTTATSGGEVIFNGNYSVTARGIVWSTSTNPTVGSHTGGGITTDGTGDGVFSSSLSGLTAGTQYFYRAYATNSQGTSYGLEYTFTTTQNGGTWAKHTDISFGGRHQSSAFEFNNVGYLVNGNNGSFLNEVLSYNPSTCQWTKKEKFPGTERGYSSAVSLNAKSYLLGGYDLNNSYLIDFWEYNPATDVWTQKSNIPGGARVSAAMFVIGNYIYAGTGAKGSGIANYQSDFYQYNPINNNWTAKANFGGGIRTGSAYFATNAKAYLGLGYDGSYKNDWWEYDPATNTWTQKANYTGNSRDVARGFCINDKGYILTGGKSDGVSYTTDNYEYDPTANTWTSRTPFPGSARSGATGFVIDGILYFGSGYDGSNKSDFYSYKPNSTPTISTTSVSSISTTSASSGGNILSDNGNAITSRGLVWSATTNTPTIVSYDGITSNGTGIGVFTQSVNALCPGTTYYIRAYATNSLGTSYGATESFTTSTSTGDIWTQKANFGGGTRNSIVAFGIGNKAFIGTGYPIASDFWEYDVFSNVWTQKANYGGGGIRAGSGFAINGKGYLGCGFDGGYRTDFWEYNPSSNVWTAKASFPGTARYNIMANATSSKGYFIGGTSSVPANVDETWEYDPVANSWTQKASFGGGVRRLGATFVNNNKLFVVGGHSTGSSVHNDTYMFDPSLNSWTQKASFGGVARNNLFGFCIGDKAYIGCGSNESNSVFYNDIWEYDIMNDIWIQKNNFSGSSRALSNTNFPSIGNKGYVGTGYDGSVLQDFYEYTPSTVPVFFVSEAGNITQNSASISANYDNNFNGCGNISISDKGFVWDITPNPTTSSNEGSISIGTGNSDFNRLIENLTPSSTYYLRSYTTSSNGTVYGNSVSFTTLAPTAPVISNLLNQAFGDNTIALSVSLNSTGGILLTNSGYIYSTSPNPNINSYSGGAVVNSNLSIGNNNHTLGNLNPETTYYIVAFAENSIGISYSNEITITTQSLSDDDDDDGITDITEYNGPNNGDGNGDGIIDALQANIASFMFDASGNFITVEAVNCATLAEVKQSNFNNDTKWFYPFGVVEFKLPCNEVEMKIYYHAVHSLSNYSYRKTNLRGEWGTFEGAIFSQDTIGGKIIATVNFPLKDGEYGDADGESNGQIFDPGGPAVQASVNIPFWDWGWLVLSFVGVLFLYQKFS